MRRLVAALLFLSFSLIAWGQQTDLLFLKSEEVVRGTIQDTTSSAGVRILLLPDSVLKIYPHDEILRIVYKKRKTYNKSSDGYQGIFRLGYTWEKGFEGEEPIGFLRADFINAVSFNDVLSLGLGFGARAGTDKQILVPVYFDLRLTPLKRRVSPMAAISFGINLQSDRNWELTGLYLSPELGMRIGEPTNTHFVVAFGLERFDFTIEKEGYFILNTIYDVEYWGWTAGLMVMF